MVKNKTFSVVESRRRNMFKATCAAYAKKRIDGPTTKPFQPSETIPKLTPAKTAAAKAAFRCSITADIDAMKAIGVAEELRISRSVPAYLTARNQNMNPRVMKSMMKPSWSARAQVVWLTCAGMKARSHAAITAAFGPICSRAMVATGKMVRAP